MTAEELAGSMRFRRYAVGIEKALTERNAYDFNLVGRL
jgi:hypothetical protein